MRRPDIVTDVLIVGNGGAGLRAAVEAAEGGARVLLTTKLAPGRPNSTSLIAGWGTYRREEEADGYFEKVVEEGNYLCDQELAWIFAHELVHRMPELRTFGVEMELDLVEQERPGDVCELWCFLGRKGRLGESIQEPLRRAALERGAEVRYSTLATRLLTSGSRVVGATAVDLSSGELVVISAKAVILATGGDSSLYARTNNPKGTTGDGFALAYRAGAELVDMEFDTIVMPTQTLRDLFGDSPDEAQILSSKSSAHYSCGGIKIDQDRRSTVEGLYAAGEVAGGTFGSARLGGSSVAEIVVSGYWAGRSAAQAARGGERIPAPEDRVRSEQAGLEGLLSREGVPPAGVHRQIREVMWERSGPLRTDARLREALVELSALRGECAQIGAKDLDELRDAIEAGLMLDVGEAVATAALTRTESRGGHWRIDHPRPDNERWLKNVIVSRGADGRPAVRLEPVSMTRVKSPGPCKVGTRWTWGYV